MEKKIEAIEKKIRALEYQISKLRKERNELKDSHAEQLRADARKEVRDYTTARIKKLLSKQPESVRTWFTCMLESVLTDERFTRPSLTLRDFHFYIERTFGGHRTAAEASLFMAENMGRGGAHYGYQYVKYEIGYREGEVT